jgi:hypothetical protein
MVKNIQNKKNVHLSKYNVPRSYIEKESKKGEKIFFQKIIYYPKMNVVDDRCLEDLFREIVRQPIEFNQTLLQQAEKLYE